MDTPPQTPDDQPEELERRPQQQPSTARRRKRAEPVEEIDERHLKPRSGVDGEGHFGLFPEVEIERIRVQRFEKRDRMYAVLALFILLAGATAMALGGLDPEEFLVLTLAPLLFAWSGRRPPTA